MEPVQQEERRFLSNKSERKLFDTFANLFALIKTVDKLEKAYVSSAADSDRYEAACAELITKYKTFRSSCADIVPDLHQFMWGNHR
mmetsp:Transcript_14727/g.53004  ORF Transcript_14727/g.53004 Transcript_14727/m.53004 type:complete len:86 (+) Transcript_14727:188-445(+)